MFIQNVSLCRLLCRQPISLHRRAKYFEIIRPRFGLRFASLFFLNINMSDIYIWLYDKRWIQVNTNFKITNRKLFFKKVQFTGGISAIIMNLSINIGVPVAMQAYKCIIDMKKPNNLLWTTTKNTTNFARGALLASWKWHHHTTRFGKKFAL